MKTFASSASASVILIVLLVASACTEISGYQYNRLHAVSSSSSESGRGGVRTDVETGVSPVIGFQNLAGNFTETVKHLKTRGNVPDWLAGSFYRNGAGWWNAELYHWFLGLSVVHVFTFHEGNVSLSSRYLNSSLFQQYIHVNASEENAWRKPMDSSPAMASSQSENTNSGVTKVAQSLLLVTATTSMNAVDAGTVDTVQSPFVFADDAVPADAPGPSHQHTDPAGNIVACYYVSGSTPGYQFYQIPANLTKRSLLGPMVPARSETTAPFFLDSFGLTEKFIVLSETPTLVLDNFTGVFMKDLGTRWHVLSRTSGAEVATFHGPAFFFFHHINAYEDEDEQGRAQVVVDVQSYPDMDTLAATTIARLRNDSSEVVRALHRGAPHRYRLPLSENGTAVTGEKLWHYPLEFPTISYDKYNTRKHRYVYGLSVIEGKSLFLDRLVKLDLGTPNPHGHGFTAAEWLGPGLYPSEPVFVPRGSHGGEDDGVVLSVVLDAAAGHSFLLVLDGEKFIEVASVPLKFVIPHGLHGRFYHNGTFPLASTA